VLEIRNLHTGYTFIQVLWGVSLQVSEGEFVALVGPNGAGKTTLLRTIAGLLPPYEGEILFRGSPTAGVAPHRICSMGLSYISESLNLFTAMSVYENLLIGAYTTRDRRTQMDSMDFVYHLFPRLKERHHQLAGTLSGGERKMLAIGRGMMSRPALMLVDEPSLGLAPLLTVDVFQALEKLRQQGVTILLVEQNVRATLRMTDRAYVLEHGKIVLEGKSRELLDNEHVKTAFMGI
jgi:ABC-type branched-subunit amino acid transport system ATPase component